ncbi:IclR family transcriptional regulator [Herbaspirillum sp. alder98]|uniref:IclR family transcriptional regulator n=1 Tax=Herbaspirillum sp. alder98 TaxID=2913096 RepID=UPI001CD84617|nr:IclR family transcriptional regulator [Herbaspirillum sp. alder98]MCA1323223.1 IclR family transcriptional regulator [Herbaspirillum sp. alder98]
MTYTVDAVLKAMELLFVVAEEGGKGVTELAKRSGNTKARAFRLLSTLEECGLVRRTMPGASYSLGYRALIIGAAAQNQLNLIQIANEVLAAVGTECNESVLVRIREGNETVCIAWWDAPHAVRVHNQLGTRRPLGVGASGKLLLAYAPVELQTDVLAQDMKKFTDHTIVKRSDLKKELKKITEDGLSASEAERTAEMVAVAAPVRDASGTVVASLSMSAPASRVSKSLLKKHAEVIRRGAERFSIALGYVAP